APCAKRSCRLEIGRRAPPRACHREPDTLSTVFIGTSEFAAAVLDRLARSEAHRPALVLTRPDRPAGRGRRMTAPPVAEHARALDIPVEQPRSVNDPGATAAIAQAGRPPGIIGARTGATAPAA